MNNRSIIVYKYGKPFGTLKLDTEDFELYKDCNIWLTHKNYACIQYNKKHTLLHRLIMNAPKDKVVDHINHDTLDNRKSNLRLVTRQENSTNLKLNPRNTSGFRGVFKRKNGTWRCVVQKHRKIIFSASFDSKEEAIQAVLNFKASVGYMDQGKLSEIKPVGPKNRQGAKKGEWVGITWSNTRQKWRACFQFHGKVYNCGYFDSKENAKIALGKKKKEIIK